MPELPEVEACRRLMERLLVGREIVAAEVAADEIVLRKAAPEMVANALVGRVPTVAGRRGKYWWLEFAEPPWLMGHLGMSGWIREIDGASIRLKSHGKASLDAEDGTPKYWKLILSTSEGRRLVFTDGRRLGRLWLADSAGVDPQVSALGLDALDELPDAKRLAAMLSRRKAPIKAVLLDQGTLSGIGNWIADEVLYQARIAPARLANSLTGPEVKRLRTSITEVIGLAVGADADYNHFPAEWLFHHRWGGDRGIDKIGNRRIVRETVGGRTTAWVPGWQK